MLFFSITEQYKDYTTHPQTHTHTQTHTHRVCILFWLSPTISNHSSSPTLSIPWKTYVVFTSVISTFSQHHLHYVHSSSLCFLLPNTSSPNSYNPKFPPPHHKPPNKQPHHKPPNKQPHHNSPYKPPHHNPSKKPPHQSNTSTSCSQQH